MSASLDTLDDLDNKTLRQKCMEFGLPNIPITDTSRNLLIKRLRVAMGGSGKPTEKVKAKPRCETVHVIRVETETTKVKEIPTPTKTKFFSNQEKIGSSLTADKGASVRAVVTQRRRSGRTTPISQLDHVVPVPRSSSSKRKVDVIQVGDADAPSLSKRFMVTTSYENGTPKETIDLGDSESDEDDEEPELIPEVEPTKYQTMSRNFESYNISRPLSSYLEREPFTSYQSGRIAQPTSRVSLSRAPISTTSFESSTARRYTTGGYKSPVQASVLRTENISINQKGDNTQTPYLSDFVRRLSSLKPEPLKSAFAPLNKSKDSNREAPRYYSAAVNSRRGISQ